MTDLKVEYCEACRKDSPSVPEIERPALLEQIPDWELQVVNDVPRLVRQFKFPDFATAIDFSNQVGALAEEQRHHPRITTEWGKVEVAWWTHKIRNLHRNDFIMAAKTDALAEAMSATPA